MLNHVPVHCSSTSLLQMGRELHQPPSSSSQGLPYLLTAQLEGESCYKSQLLADQLGAQGQPSQALWLPECREHRATAWHQRHFQSCCSVLPGSVLCPGRHVAAGNNGRSGSPQMYPLQLGHPLCSPLAAKQAAGSP